MKDIWFPLALLAVTGGLLLVAGHVAIHLVLRHRCPDDVREQAVAGAAAHHALAERATDVVLLDPVEPVRSPDGRIDVDATVRREGLRHWWLYLFPGGRTTAAHHRRLLRLALERTRREED
ncbi:hypothetical protein [Nocardioides dongkuii]|uniref:hypothetical protein n=1 Tax=Nocardioides dongkuii TaxID=2760089 RepID=UPI0015FC52A7|nr:hypothetical protein [Nocardioides dongkuii]